MNTQRSSHLTDEQFTELLVGGTLNEAGRSHLAACDRCREEAGKFTDSVGLFSTSSLAWSETQPRRNVRAVAAQRARRAVWAPVGLAFASAMAILIGVPAWNHSHLAPASNQAAVVSPAEDSPADIEADNQLMQSVNVALNTNDDSPLPEYRLFAGTQPAARTTSRTQ